MAIILVIVNDANSI